jgi:ribosomal protein L40E
MVRTKTKTTGKKPANKKVAVKQKHNKHICFRCKKVSEELYECPECEDYMCPKCYGKFGLHVVCKKCLIANWRGK